MKRYFLLMSVCLSYGNTILSSRQAIVCVPVADLVGQSQKILGTKKVHRTYTKIPICGEKGNACPRIHQLLFHEVVTLLEEYEDEVKVKVPNLFFETKKELDSGDTYWTLKKNIISFEQLEKHHINLAYIPRPLCYEEKKIEDAQPIITLVLPYYDYQTGIHFSAGTRFVAQADQPYESTVAVYALDPSQVSIKKILLPRTLCLAQNVLTREQKIALFVDIIKQWTQQKHGFIPYVWGGCSFSNLCTIDQFTTKETHDTRGRSISFYQRSDSKKLHTGFDCSGLVARAAQLAGIPYFFKNTTTLAKYLKQLDHVSSVHKGDLIWLPGHIMIAADLEKNTIIEARHYNQGYGKVHELPLKEVFKDVETFKDLHQKFIKQKPLVRLHRNGSAAQTISTFKLLSLASVWGT